MIVSINTICFFDRDRNQYLSDNYWVKIFLKIIQQHPEHHFIFFSENPLNDINSFPNLSFVVLGDIPSNFLRARIWFRYKMNKELKKNHSEILVQIGGFPFKGNVPQILLSPDLTEIFLPKKLTNTELGYLKKKIPTFYKNIQQIIVGSQWEKNQIDKKYPGFSDKIQVWPQEMILNFTCPSLEEKELIKEQYAGGNEFFIYSGLIGTQMNLMNLLKAFSAFKKRQKSGMRLIITGKKAIDFDAFSEQLENYRFKNEIAILPSISDEENLHLIGASYAIIFPSMAEVSTIAALQAMDLGVPVLSPKESVIREISVEAGLYFSSEDFKSIAEKMMLIFKDENLRKELCKKGKDMVQQYQPTDNGHQLLQLLEIATKKIAPNN